VGPGTGAGPVADARLEGDGRSVRSLSFTADGGLAVVVHAEAQGGGNRSPGTIAITDTRGEVKSFGSIQFDAWCPGFASPVISYDSLTPFLQTLGCRYSKASFSGADPGVVPDPRCKNGLFTSGPGTVAVNLLVDAPATHRIEIDGCNRANQLGKLTATLLLPPDTSPLATLAPVGPASSGPDGACASIDYAFVQAGTYQLSIVIADGYLPVGDFFLQFY